MLSKWKVADMVSVVRTFCENSLIKNGKVVLLMTQVFCMLPVSGVFKNDLQAIGFSYFSVKVILFAAVTASISCMSVTYSAVFVLYHCRLTAAGTKKISLYTHSTLHIFCRIRCVLHYIARIVCTIFSNCT